MKIKNSDVFSTDVKLYLKNILFILLIIDLAITYKLGFQIIPLIRLLGINLLIIVLFYLINTKESVIFKNDIIIFSKKNIINKSTTEYPLESISYNYKNEVHSRGGSIPVITFYYKEKAVFKIIEGRDWSNSSITNILLILEKCCKKENGSSAVRDIEN